MHLSCCDWFNENTGATEKFKSYLLQKISSSLQDSVLKRLTPFLNSIDNRLASLLDRTFKHKWIEDDVEKKEAMRVLQAQVTSSLGRCEEDCSSTSTDDENERLAKKLKLFGFIAAGSKKNKPGNSERELERYFEEEIIQFDEDPLMQRRSSRPPNPPIGGAQANFGGPS